MEEAAAVTVVEVVTGEVEAEVIAGVAEDAVEVIVAVVDHPAAAYPTHQVVDPLAQVEVGHTVYTLQHSEAVIDLEGLPKVLIELEEVEVRSSLATVSSWPIDLAQARSSDTMTADMVRLGSKPDHSLVQ